MSNGSAMAGDDHFFAPLDGAYKFWKAVLGFSDRDVHARLL